MMKHTILSAAALLAAALSPSAFAQAPTYAVSFDALTPGTAITTENTGLSFVRNAGAAPYTSSLTAMASSFGSGNSLRMLSSGYSSTPNATAIGQNNLAKSSVYSMSVDITSNLWQTATWTYMMMGEWDTGSSNMVYNPSGAITTTNVTNATIGQQSLFALALFGSTAGNGAYLRTIKADGSWANIKNTSTNQDIILTNGEIYSLHIVANGSTSAITVGSDTIAAGYMGIYIGETLVGTTVIADSVDANAFRILATGNSGGNLQTTLEVGDIKIWNSAVAPIPETSATAVLLGAGVLLGVLVRRRR